MDKEISEDFARKIMKILDKLGLTINELHDLYSIIDDVPKQEAKRKLKHNLGELMLVSFKLTSAIVRQHNSLDPDKDRITTN